MLIVTFPFALFIQAMTIAADLCVYTNHNFVIEKLGDGEESKAEDAADSKSE